MSIKFSWKDTIPFVSGGLITGLIAILIKTQEDAKLAMSLYGFPIGLTISLVYIQYFTELSTREISHKTKSTVDHLLPALIRIIVSNIVLMMVFYYTESIVWSIMGTFVAFVLMSLWHYYIYQPPDSS
jgi:FtsH-binding integral membrane protein